MSEPEMYANTGVTVWCRECDWGMPALNETHGRSLWKDHKEYDCEED